MSRKKKHHERPDIAEGPQRAAEEARQTEGGQAPAAEEDPLAAKTRECEELLARLQRTTADYLNYQRRADRRLGEAKREAVRDLLLDLLPAIDNFERALAAVETEPDFRALRDGIRLVHDQLVSAIEKHGARKIEAVGQPFDPERHEAAAHVPSDEHPEGHVAEVIQTGYQLHGETLRASRVAVSSGKPAEPKTDRPGEQGADKPGAAELTEAEPAAGTEGGAPAIRHREASVQQGPVGEDEAVE